MAAMILALASMQAVQAVHRQPYYSGEELNSAHGVYSPSRERSGQATVDQNIRQGGYKRRVSPIIKGIGDKSSLINDCEVVILFPS